MRVAEDVAPYILEYNLQIDVEIAVFFAFIVGADVLGGPFNEKLLQTNRPTNYPKGAGRYLRYAKFER